MSSKNTDIDTPSKYDNYSLDKFSNYPNIYRPKPNGSSRNRENSVHSIDNGQITSDNRRKNSSNNIRPSPAVSATSVITNQTTPVTRPYHKHSHSRSSSTHSSHSTNSSRYITKESPRASPRVSPRNSPRTSPYLQSSGVTSYSDNVYRPMKGKVSDNNIYRPLGLRKSSLSNSLNINSKENDVTSLSNSHSNSTLNSYHNNQNNTNNNNSNKNNNNSNNNNNNTNENNFTKNRGKLKENSNSSKQNKISHTKSNSSNREKESIHPPSSDIGSYYASSHGMTSTKPKSNVSYPYESSARTLNNNFTSSTTALNTHIPNTNSYNPNNYLSANYTDIKKKYSSCYSISSNSTILAPPQKYLNNNCSVYSYPKLKQMIYILIIMIIVFFTSSYAVFSSRLIIVNTNLKVDDDNQNISEEFLNKNLIYHYEFGMFRYCYRDNTDDTPTSICQNISEHCPTFCTRSSCINFNPNDDGKVYEDFINVEDSIDPEFSFCKLTSKSRRLSGLYILLNFINVVLAAVIVFLVVKYRGSKKKNIKDSLIKRLSIISDHYSFINEKHKSKLKNSNTNLASPTSPTTSSDKTSKNNNNNNLSVIEFHRQYSEPEAIEIIEDEPGNSKSNSKDSRHPNNSEGKKKKPNHSNSTHITYNIPASSSLSPRASPFMTPSYIREQNRIQESEEEQSGKRKRILKWLFSFLITISLILGLIGVYYIFKWARERQHIGMSYLRDIQLTYTNIDTDISMGVSLILIAISSVLNTILGIYLIVLLCIIHFSRSKTYWNNEGDDDTYSQSYDSLHPSNSYHPSLNGTNYNPGSYNPNQNTYIP